MRYQILYQPSYSLAVVQLEQGEAIMAESGAMVSMSATIRLEAKMAGGGFMGALKSVAGGESHLPHHLHRRERAGRGDVRPSTVGDIMPVDHAGLALLRAARQLPGRRPLVSTSACRAACAGCSPARVSSC